MPKRREAESKFPQRTLFDLGFHSLRPKNVCARYVSVHLPHDRPVDGTTTVKAKWIVVEF
eukprot:429079-Prorocentrum_minimum.AAC.4